MKNSNITSKLPAKRLDELNYFNAIACLFVVLIHVLSVGITSLDKSSLQMALVYIPWKIAAYVVPGFLFTGAVKMALGFNAEKQPSYFSYIWRRIVKIYIPYVIYVLLYYAYFVHIGWYTFDLKLIVHSIVFGDISSPFYYVVTVMQFYLLMPLWKWLCNRTPWFTTLPVCALISFASYRIGDVLASFGVNFPWGDRIFPTYIFFWALGLYVGKYYNKVYKTILKHKCAVLFCGIPAAAFSVMNYLQYRTNRFVYIADANCMKLISDTMSIFFVLCVCILIKNADLRKLKGVLNFIFASSFTVYLVHCLFLNIADKQLTDHGITDIGVKLIVRALVCFTLPFLWYFITSSVSKLFRKLTKRKN